MKCKTYWNFHLVTLFRCNILLNTGGHLRYQLYIWLEREVEALRRLCGYASTRGANTGGDKNAGGELICAEVDPPPLPDQPTLHQLLVREKADFEAKVQRAVSRKKWLKGEMEFIIDFCMKIILFISHTLKHKKTVQHSSIIINIIISSFNSKRNPAPHSSLLLLSPRRRRWRPRLRPDGTGAAPARAGPRQAAPAVAVAAAVPDYFAVAGCGSCNQ